MTIAQTLIAALAGLIVLAEALNKLERTAPFAPGLGRRARLVVWLKLAGWALLALGAAGALAVPVFALDPSWRLLAGDCTVTGFAVLVLRSRLREVESDDFTQTRAWRRP